MRPQGYAEHLAHLARLGRLPAWRAYVWDQAQQIDRMPGWAGFADALVKAIRG